jgi:hypothetical protein
MGRGIRPKLSFANVMVVVLTFIVLGGGAYAATQLPANSVGTAQIRDRAVTGSKLSKKVSRELVKLAKRYAPIRPGLVAPAGPAGQPGPTGPGGVPGGTVAAGVTLRGAVGAVVEEPTAGGTAGTGVSFGFELPARPSAHVVPEGGPAPPACPGTSEAPEAASGNLCVYLAEVTPSDLGQVVVSDPGRPELAGINFDLETEETVQIGDGKVGKFGFHLVFFNPGPLNGAQLRGTWAATG